MEVGGTTCTRCGTSVECVGMPTGNKLSVCALLIGRMRHGLCFLCNRSCWSTRSSASEITEQVMHVHDDFDARCHSVVLWDRASLMNYDATRGYERRLNSRRSRHSTPYYGFYLRCYNLWLLGFASEPEHHAKLFRFTLRCKRRETPHARGS